MKKITKDIWCRLSYFVVISNYALPARRLTTTILIWIMSELKIIYKILNSIVSCYCSDVFWLCFLQLQILSMDLQKISVHIYDESCEVLAPFYISFYEMIHIIEVRKPIWIRENPSQMEILSVSSSNKYRILIFYIVSLETATHQSRSI